MSTRSRSRSQSGGRSERGFASMDRDEQRRIASRGGRASHGGRGRDYESDYDEDYDRDYDDYSGRYDDDYYDDYESEYDEYDDYESDYEEEDYDRGGRRSGGRGFASMDREKQRRIASMGGRASHSGGRRSRDEEYDDQSYGSYDRGYESGYDEDYDRGGRRSGGRGFASMDREKQRRIASMGGRASHSGGRRSSRDGGGSSRGRSSRSSDRRSSSSRGSQDGTSRRGFASMDPEKQRRIASMGGRAAHRYGTAHEFSSEEARRAGRKGGRARWND